MNNEQWILLSLWLNRVGITLDFLAGFMLAPEIIGLDRIQKLENIFEDRLLKIKKNLLQPFEYEPLGTSASAAKLENEREIRGWFTLKNLKRNRDNIVNFYSSKKVPLWRKIVNSITYPFSGILFLAVAVILLPIFLLLIIWELISFVYLVIISWFIKLLNLILAKLEGDEKLKRFITVQGIFFFILGNILQLIATL